MQFNRILCLIALALPTTVACRSQPAATAAAFTDAATARDAKDANSGANNSAPMPHGDHRPHYGGVVYMHGDMHFEVVLDRGGRHRLYFSDAVRADLPASVASSVTLTVTRPGWSPEAITAAIDDEGEGWRAEGAPVGPGEATARVAFVVQDEPYWIDIPFMPPSTSPSP